MILGILTLFVAISISAVSAFYSILGLTAIFAGAYWPIVIMGVSLEAGKITSAVWLHYNWERADWKIKSYLVLAVGILMIITSLGVFGFLSKAHSEQSVPTGDIQAQVQLFDEKIKTQRDNIDSSRKALTQMDGAVDQILGRTTDENGATKSANLRRSQAKERARLQTDIDQAQKQITTLQEQRAPVASKFRQVVADVGPITYLAALIYGDKTDQNMLEAAVRWVIIIIVFVFDPLAIILILAATTSIDWSKLDRRKKKHDELLEKLEETKEAAELAALQAQVSHVEAVKKSEEEILKIVEDTIALTRAECAVELEKAKLDACAECSIVAERKLHEANLLITVREAEQSRRYDEIAEVTGLLIKATQEANDLASFVNRLEEEVSESLGTKDKLESNLHTIINEYDDLLAEKTALSSAFSEAKAELEIFDETVRQMGVLQGILAERDEEIKRLNTALEKTAKLVIETPLPVVTPTMLFPTDDELHEMYKDVLDNEAVRAIGRWTEPELPEVVVDENLEVDTEPAVEMPAPVDRPVLPLLPTKRIIVMPQLSAVPDNFPLGGNASFGVTFPSNPIKGDLFLRVDYMPSKLFKWTDAQWIEVDKSSTDTYAFDVEYVKLLIAQIESGELDADDLNTIEQEQIAAYLRSTKT